jgi:hypothetical protein
MQKDETGPLSYTIHKNQLKMDKNPKYKMRNYKTPGREGKIFINNTSNK